MNLPTHGQIVNKLEKAKIIRPYAYAPLFGSSRVSALLRTFSCKKSVRKNSGLYKIGYGEKSVIWYWEFDVEKRYFHQFKTIDYAAAVEFYKANKLTMWGGKEVKGDAEGNQEDREGEGDFHERAAEHACEEQRQAEADVQGQNSGQNVRDGSGDSKDNDDRQDNEEERRGNRYMGHSS